MKTVQQLLQGKPDQVLSVSPTATVYEALTLMARHDIGALIVVDGETLAGMFSERDYARKVVLHGKASKDVPVADIMTTTVMSVGPRAHG